MKNCMAMNCLVHDDLYELGTEMPGSPTRRFKIVDTLTNKEYDIISSMDHLNGSPSFFRLKIDDIRVEDQDGDLYVEESDYDDLNERGAVEI